MRFSFLYILIFTFFALSLCGQNRNIIIGYGVKGICIGNSKRCDGFRVSLWDKDVEAINGINISFKSSAKKSNGLSIGLLFSSDSISNGVKIGGIGAGAAYVNGVAIASLGVWAEQRFNGVGISGFALAADTMNGFFFSILGTTKWNTNKIDVINGATIGIIGCNTKKLNGFALGFANYIVLQKGVAIGYVLNRSEEVNGVQVSLLSNKAQELHGLQIGLINYAGNNSKWLRWMPLLNFHR